ncbi:MAG: heavy metal-associated domain-containing protein [Saprospiraceae bacterium]
MITENITIANLSCNGCVKTITKKLTAIEGVEKVDVDLETNMVSVNHIESLGRETLTQTLLAIGYPEITDKNSVLTHLKSVSSCLTGRFSS